MQFNYYSQNEIGFNNLTDCLKGVKSLTKNQQLVRQINEFVNDYQKDKTFKQAEGLRTFSMSAYLQFPDINQQQIEELLQLSDEALKLKKNCITQQLIKNLQFIKTIQEIGDEKRMSTKDFYKIIFNKQPLETTHFKQLLNDLKQKKPDVISKYQFFQIYDLLTPTQFKQINIFKSYCRQYFKKEVKQLKQQEEIYFDNYKEFQEFYLNQDKQIKLDFQRLNEAINKLYIYSDEIQQIQDIVDKDKLTTEIKQIQYKGLIDKQLFIIKINYLIDKQLDQENDQQKIDQENQNLEKTNQKQNNQEDQKEINLQKIDISKLDFHIMINNKLSLHQQIINDKLKLKTSSSKYLIHHINSNYLDNRLDNLFIIYNDIEYKEEFKRYPETCFLERIDLTKIQLMTLLHQYLHNIINKEFRQNKQLRQQNVLDMNYFYQNLEDSFYNKILEFKTKKAQNTVEFFKQFQISYWETI